MSLASHPSCWVWVALFLFSCASSGEAGQSNPYFDSCDGGPPDEQCYSVRRDPNSANTILATNVALRYMAEHPATAEPWDWRAGVLMFALTELHRVTGDSRLQVYYRAYLERHIERGYTVRWSDHCPPALTAISLLEEGPNADYQTVVDDVLFYLTDVAPRLPEGGISHQGTIGTDALWLDSLFMFGMVLTRWAEQSGEPEPTMLIAEQFRIFADLMQDASGLMVHAYAWPNDFDTDIYWARGNSWVTASMADFLRAQTIEGGGDSNVQAIFDAQVRAILESQNPATGLWWTLLNRPDEIYEETSASALFAYALARAYRYGLVGEDELSAAMRAVEGVKAKIVPDENDRPIVTGISGPTGVGVYANYAAVPLEQDLSYGVGAAILALIETSGLEDLPDPTR